MLRKRVIINKNFDGDVTEQNEGKDFIISAIGTMAVEDKPNLVALLTKNGVLVTDLNTQSELLDASFKAIRDSATFRDDLKQYLSEVGNSVYSGEEQTANFLNATGIGKFFSSVGSGIKNLFKSKPKIWICIRNNWIIF